MAKLLAKSKKDFFKLVRSHRRLINDGGLNKIRNIINNLSKFQYELRVFRFDTVIYDENYCNDKSVTQFIFDRYVGKSLRLQLVIAEVTGKSVTLALPNQALRYLESEGFKINHLNSAVLWWLEGIKQIIKSNIFIAKSIYYYIQNSIKNHEGEVFSNYFFGCADLNLTRSEYERPDLAMAKWMGELLSDQENTSVGVVGMHGAVKYKGIIFLGTNGPEYKIGELIILFQFLIKASYLSLYSFIVASLGAWHRIFLLNEILASLSVKLSHRNEVNLTVHTLYIGQTYRPIWSYSRESNHWRNKIFFGSIIEEVLINYVQVSHDYQYGRASWSEYIVWDLQHSIKLKNLLGDSIVTVIAPPFLHKNKSMNNSFSGLAIAVYPVSPPDRRFHLGISSSSQYHGPGHNSDYKFLLDIALCAIKLDINVYIKNKRNLGLLKSKKYDSLVKKLSQYKNIQFVDEDISPASLSSFCHGSLSMPYTATAIFKVKMESFSAYYDPTGLLIDDKSRSRGHQLIAGAGALENFMRSLSHRYEKFI